MVRRIFGFALMALAAYGALQARSTDRWFTVAIFLLLGFIVTADLWLRFFPDSKFARLSWRQIGPRMDVENMSRGEILRSARWCFLVFLSFGCAYVLSVVFALGPGTADVVQAALMAISFAVFFPAVMSLLVALYLLFQAVKHRKA